MDAKTIHPDRLCELADRAIANLPVGSRADAHSLVTTPAFVGCDWEEVNEALKFLIRLGVAEEVNA